MKTPRLGSASILLSINDDEGLTVTHGDGTLLASKPAVQCENADWKSIWAHLELIGVRRIK